jgi:tetratricopeptide (TPR) repeat protein
MAQESREWYQNDSYEAEMPVEEAPSGRFNPDEIEFESFMFDGGQGIGVDLSRSGPLAGANGHPSAVMEQSPPQTQDPFAGAEVPRRAGSGPLRSLRNTGPLQGATSGPLAYGQAAPQEGSPFAGSPVRPQSGPLHNTGPIVDGRTSSSGSGPLTQTGPLTWAGAMAGGTGPLTQRNTGPLGQNTSGPLSQDAGRAQNGSLNQQSRLSGLLAQRQQTGSLGTTGPLGNTGPLRSLDANTGPLTPPSRFMHSGPLTPADVEDVSSNGQPPQSFVDYAAPADGQRSSVAQTSSSVPVPTNIGWSDSSLAAVEDFSSVLLALDEAKKLTTSGSLSAASIPSVTAPTRDSGALYSNAVPVIHDTGPHYVSADAGDYEQSGMSSDGIASDPVAWSEGQSWQPAYSPSTQATDAQAEAQQAIEPAADVTQMQAQSQVEEAQLNVSGNGFSGEALQFEPFMFDGATETPELPYVPEFMSSVTGMEGAFTQDEAQLQQAPSVGSMEMPSGPDGEALPFWLQNTGNLNSQSLAGGMQAPNAMPQVSAFAPVAHDTEEAATPEGQDESLYADLPPIDPFDFASLELAVEDESLGFNTEELSGFSRSSYEPMTATADLQVVASILGTDPDLGIMESAPLRPQMVGTEVQSSTSEPSDEQSAGADFQAEAPFAPSYSTSQPDAQARSWTATDTSSLSMDLLEGTQPAAEMSADELDVAPFDFTDLNLEDQELGTNYLDYRRPRGTGPLSARSRGTGPLQAIAASDLPNSPPEEPAQEVEQPQAAPPPQPQVTPRKWATSWLGDSATQPAPVEEPVRSEPAQAANVQPESVAVEIAAPEPTQSWQVQPEETPTEMSDMSPADQPEEEPVLSFMRDERFRTGSLAFADDDGDEQDAGAVATEEYQEVAPAAQEDNEPGFAYAGEDQSQGDAFEPLASDEVVGEDYPWSAPEIAQTEAAEQHSTEYDASPGANYTTAEPEVEDESVQVYTAPEWSEQAATQVAYPVEEMKTEPAQAQDAPVEHVASVAPPTSPYTYQPMQAVPHEEPAAEYEQPVRFPTSVLASGPLPSLDGFEELQDLVDSNPNDVGAHIALASAYAQVGDVDTQLRVYRRVLRKPAVSNKILRLIAEELTDYEADLSGHPHFHQVRGDLYMKQNRYQEAIAEYNKIV